MGGDDFRKRGARGADVFGAEIHHAEQQATLGVTAAKVPGGSGGGSEAPCAGHADEDAVAEGRPHRGDQA